MPFWTSPSRPVTGTKTRIRDSCDNGDVRIGILGPLDVRDGAARPIEISGPQASCPADPAGRGRGPYGPGRAADRRSVGRRAADRRGQRAAGSGVPPARGGRPRRRRVPARAATGSPSTRHRSTPSRSSGSWQARARRERPGRPRREAAARRSACGAGPRSPTSPARPSPPPRSPGWRSCAPRPSRNASTPTSPSAAPRGSCPNWRSSPPSTRCANGCAASSCAPCTPRAGRPTPSPCTRTPAVPSPTAWAWTPHRRWPRCIWRSSAASRRVPSPARSPSRRNRRRPHVP